MLAATTNDTIRAGDTVILYFTPKTSLIITVQPPTLTHTHHGSFAHADLLNQRYGSRIASTSRRAFATLLRLTPELWTRMLPHRTQIVYTPDIAFVSMQLDLQAGSWVVESGTGSGSMTHALARTVSPGRVFSFEYHAQRAQAARDEVLAHGLDGVVRVTHADVYQEGFAVLGLGEGGLEGRVDAVFLDLPEPWMALKHVPALFRRQRQGRVATFSPCMEQVQRTCAVLRDLGFTDICMFEVHEREWYTNMERTEADIERLIFQNSGGKEMPLESKNPPKDKLVGRVVRDMKGHTAYLTFASYNHHPALSAVDLEDQQGQ